MGVVAEQGSCEVKFEGQKQNGIGKLMAIKMKVVYHFTLCPLETFGKLFSFSTFPSNLESWFVLLHRCDIPYSLLSNFKSRSTNFYVYYVCFDGDISFLDSKKYR